mmetsp:Transcript_20716/g.53441  ORF Transcript_20716/g.53441 Transcript_20716/m.53441 type:complete len:448 (-) Transcript_20716:550-1893(-)
MDLAGPHHHAIGRGAHHKGPGQGGNKSMVSFRVGYGIPGYTGYIPTVDAVPIPSKEGISDRPERNAFTTVPSDPPALNGTSTTVYRKDYTINDADFRRTAGTLPYNPNKTSGSASPFRGTAPRTAPGNRSGNFGHTGGSGAGQAGEGDGQQGGHGAGEAGSNSEGKPRTAGGMGSTTGSQFGATGGSNFPVAKMQGKSLYRGDFDGSARTAGSLSATVPNRGSQSRLESTYSSSFNHVEEGNDVHKQIRMGERETRHRPPPTKREHVENPINMRLRAPTTDSTYRKTYGGYIPDVDNRPKIAKTVQDFSSTASSRDLFHGTTKSAKTIPHYAGFIPSSSQNKLAAAHGQCEDPRATTKDFGLLNLDQFPNHVPGYGGYQPTTVFNKRGGFVPSTLTTSGRNFSKHPGYESPEFGILNQMHKDFFQPGQTSQSANGNADAEVFFNRVR